MAESPNQLFKIFRRDWLFTLSLGGTLTFFIYKGILYALIGSYIPLLFILTMLALLAFSLNRSPKAFQRSVGLWSVLVILWSAVRLLLGIVNQFVKPIPEGHIDGQLGLMSVLVSITFLVACIYIWRKRKGIMAEIEAIY